MPNWPSSFKYWIDLPSDQQFVPVCDIRRLVWGAAEKGGVDQEAAFAFGFSIDELSVQQVVLDWRNDKRLRVLIPEGLGELTGEDVKSGVLRRADFTLLVGEVFHCGVRGHMQQPESTPSPMQRRRAQELAILAKLGELGFDAQAIPAAPAGKPSPAKQAVREALGYTADVMNKAWQRLREASAIKDA